MAEARDQLIKAVAEGKAVVGAQNVIGMLLSKNSPKTVFLSANCPRIEKESISYYGRLAGIQVETLPELSIELGSICGKPYPISVAAVK